MGNIAHQHTQRKTRCDPGLPRCGPCERTNSVCEYYDSNKGHNVNRNYVVYLQHKVRELEEELARAENEDAPEDPEAMMRAATVRLHEEKDSKFLGPSSGIAMTRLVMQLAKQITDARSIKDIVPEERARAIKDLFHQEHAKPTSKVYPLISDVAAVELPNRALTDLLVQLYKLKVQPLYPALHEPSLDRDVEAVYQLGSGATTYQNFVCRMVIAISLQKMDTQYAGLADSYYLAALKFLEPVVKAMNLKTLQCFALMAEYSLLTPTRTAIYYVVGIAVRLAQSLGFAEEKNITRPNADGSIDHLEVDMRRRLFYCIIVMDFGLSHSLGRPAMLATDWDHNDVGWFETCDDKFITPEGIDPAAPRPTLKKWVAIHFFKMRMLQLEIRRKLYLRKRPVPRSDSDPWFIKMEAKLAAWRDAAPSADEGFGLDKAWFIARFNTMVVFLFRPSPQVPRPSSSAALKCYDACEYNIFVQRKQITARNVDLTWVFTQTIFMAINTVLWSLSYEEVRTKYSRESVESTLDVAMDAIGLASERWPGVASAVNLYQNLIAAIMKIYDKNGDVPISAASPSDVASPVAAFLENSARSRTTSPATVASSSVATPWERPQMPLGQPPQHLRSAEQEQAAVYQPQAFTSMDQSHMQQGPPIPPSGYQTMGYNNNQAVQSAPYDPFQQQQQWFDPYTQYNPLPPFQPDLASLGLSTDPSSSTNFVTSPTQSQFDILGANHPAFDPNHPGYPFPATSGQSFDMHFPQEQYMQGWDMDVGDYGAGLTQDQQAELMLSLETEGMEDIRGIITSTLAAVAPKRPQHSS